MSMKNSYDTIGNRTRDLPVCIAVRFQYYEVKIIFFAGTLYYLGEFRTSDGCGCREIFFRV